MDRSIGAGSAEDGSNNGLGAQEEPWVVVVWSAMDAADVARSRGVGRPERAV